MEQAFLEVYDAHADALFRHCYFRVYHREEAKELMQESFTRVWQCLAEGQKVKNVRALAYRIAHNLIVDRIRKKRETSLEELQETGFEPVSGMKGELEMLIDGRMLLGQCASLESEYRDVLYMRYVDDLAPREIAHITGLSVNVISVRIHRGLKKLHALTEKKSAVAHSRSI